MSKYSSIGLLLWSTLLIDLHHFLFIFYHLITLIILSTVPGKPGALLASLVPSILSTNSLGSTGSSVKQSKECLLFCASKRINLFAILVDLEGWHRFNSGFLGDRVLLINVNLLHDQLGIVRHLFFIDGRNCLTRWTPIGVEIHH